MEPLGPGLGTEADHIISNMGKMNKHGNLEVHGLGPHTNPVLDGSAHMGINLLDRHSILKEPVPSFVDYEGPNSYLRGLACSQ
jgi:hypothetical protein